MSLPAGSLNLASVQDAIYDWINSVTKGVLDEIQIVWKDQAQSLPPRPFVGLKMIYGPSPTDRDSNVFLNADGSMNVGMQQEGVLSVQVFGNTQITNGPIANQLAIDIGSSLLRQTVRDALKRGGVSIQGRPKIQNLTALEESKYEERAGFDIDLGFVQNIGDVPGTIGTVNIGSKVNQVEQPVQTITLP